ncbi:cation:proton antiporter [Methanocorpusculum sp.]|uniref:cation:proton antiporter domain-containing protein n=1 Tax=Methanocorpusculum sp. TaxID=2058474 RepID=UPI00272B975B|nr:cation:proton antiporter [Methanocorpusculum sp.]
MVVQMGILLAVVIVLACSIGVLFISKKIHIPFIIGYFITGIIVGPFGLHLITEEQVAILAELGVILLMFTIGLEISLKNLLSMKKVVLIGGGMQMIITTVLIWAALQLAGLPSNTAIFLGMMVSTSSTAIVLNIYQTKGQMATKHGKIALGILIFQDLAVVPMMMLAPILAGPEETNLLGTVLNFVVGLGMLGIILIAAIYLVPKFLQRVALTRSSELFIISIVTICLGIAWLMSLNGVSLALGAFLAGVAISESDYSHEVIGQIMPIRDLLTSFFFVSIGMLLNLTFLAQHLPFLLILAAALIIAKLVVSFISVKVIGMATGVALLSAFGLSQIGEFSFVLGATGYSSGILSDNMYQIFLAVSIMTMIMTPTMISIAPKFVDRFFPTPVPEGPGYSSPAGSVEDELPIGHVIIVGYGLTGHYVAKALKKVSIPYVILELNPETVSTEKKLGENIHYGDASREGILEFAGIKKAQTIVVSIPQMDTTKAIVTTARRMNPKIGIITRSRYISETAELYRLGADEVIVDEKEAALQIFHRILSNQQVPVQDFDLYAKQARNEIYDKYIEMPINSNLKLNTKGGKFEIVRMRAKQANEMLSKNKSRVEQIRVEKGSKIAGKRISDVQLRKNYGVSVIAVRCAGKVDAVVSPDGDTILNEGDTAVVIGDRDSIASMMVLFAEKIE